jgi:hypothetical protein
MFPGEEQFMLTRPLWLLRVEGAFVLILATNFYRAGHFSWWLFAALFLAPDLFMLGYLINVKWGAASYNLVHTLSAALLLLLAGYLGGLPQLTPFALIWLAHIGLDRMLGFGLKYPTQFNDTHLQHV